MKYFKLWFESQNVVSYSGKPIITYISAALGNKINNFHLPNWQQNVDFLNRIKYLVDNEGDEHLMANQQEFEKNVIKFAMAIAHAQMNIRIRKEKEDNPNLETSEGEYERCYPGDKFERVICGEGGKQSAQGMPAFKLDNVLGDKELNGFYGIHVGDADEWLDWLIDDGYCSGDIYIYEIIVPDNPPFYVAEDHNSGGFAGEYADKQVPDGQIIFSQLKVIPANLITLKSMIREKQYWKERKRREKNGY
jgi:hypothetical protein